MKKKTGERKSSSNFQIWLVEILYIFHRKGLGLQIDPHLMQTFCSLRIKSKMLRTHTLKKKDKFQSIKIILFSIDNLFSCQSNLVLVHFKYISQKEKKMKKKQKLKMIQKKISSILQ